MTANELQKGARLDQFTIVEAIGHGAFSDVYLATDTNGRDVVLKCPHESIMGDVSTFDRFRRELEISKHLHHPGIQRPIEFTSDRSRPYMVMEYINGQTLRALLSKEKRLSVDKTVDFGCQLASAMAHAHEVGVVHRDLKPENVLVDTQGKLVVTDFGVAFMAGARRLTWRWFSTALGTPDYMSPEQIQGKRGDARSDVYAIGVMLFEMLAGRVPWEGDNALSVMSQHINAPVPPIHEINPAVPPPIEGIIRKCLRKNPDERYEDATSLERDLQNWRDLPLSQFIFGDEQTVAPPANSDLRLVLLIFGVSAAFLAASIFLLVLAYLIGHAH
ncbi:MAG TPA: serine/threonine-protein kinase [Candidatus Limnocylindrales bacterium]